MMDVLCLYFVSSLGRDHALWGYPISIVVTGNVCFWHRCVWYPYWHGGDAHYGHCGTMVFTSQVKSSLIILLALNKVLVNTTYISITTNNIIITKDRVIT